MEDFIKKVEDLYKRSLNKNIVTCTGFLTPAEKQTIITKLNYTNAVFLGGVKSAERVRVFFLPDYMEEIDIKDYVTAFCANFSFKKLSHRDFLGALLSLGIERRCRGDIYVFEKEAYFLVTNDIASYVKNNFDKVSNVGVKLKEVSLDEVVTIDPVFKEIVFSVSGLRLDSVVSGSINESREKSNLLVKSGVVLLNYLVCEIPSKEVREGDIFSIKGYGKYVLKEIGGESRRGKIFVKVNKYI